jgi:anti-anti-sigma factor
MVSRPGMPLTVSVVAPSDSPSVWVRLVGDVDMVGESALAEAIDRLDRPALRLVVIDLAAVTFACSTLANFLAALHQAHPGAALVLHRASPMVRRIVRVTGVDRFVVMSGDPVSAAESPPGGLEHLPPAGVAAVGDGDEAFTVARDRLHHRCADAGS